MTDRAKVLAMAEHLTTQSYYESDWPDKQREALAHDRKGDSLQLVATLESALLADDGADIQASKIKT